MESSRAKWRARAKALQARVTELKATLATREVHMQEETARALAQEREVWQRDREVELPWQRESRASFRAS